MVLDLVILPHEGMLILNDSLLKMSLWTQTLLLLLEA